MKSYGEDHIFFIAKMMNRDPKEILIKWLVIADVDGKLMKKHKWSEVEDLKLKELCVEQENHDWSHIAQ